MSVVPHILFVGPFPPPVHGQAVATQAMWDQLAERGIPARRIDSGSRGAGRTGFADRLRQHLSAAAQLFRFDGPHLYLSVNANAGIAMTALVALAGRLAGKQITLHHHCYRYIAKGDPLMALLALCAGKKAMHITNCTDMGRELSARYPAVAVVQGYNNVGVVDPAMVPTLRAGANVVLGHISNLTEAKGLGRAIAAFAEARKIWPDIELHVAGPCSEDYARDSIARAEAEYGPAFTYLGPVYGEAKADFFRNIDIMVFPSLYPTETQGIVNLEAMASGKPVIAFAQCCIGSDIGTKGGVAVAKGDDFGAALIGLVRHFLTDRARASALARERFDELLAAHQEEKRRIFERLKAA